MDDIGRQGFAHKKACFQPYAEARVIEQQVKIIVYDGMVSCHADIGIERFGKTKQGQCLVDDVRA
ncbi:hypothetical protein D9M72_562990 [compost metagenome]